MMRGTIYSATNGIGSSIDCNNTTNDISTKVTIEAVEVGDTIDDIAIREIVEGVELGS
jgi:hypothetical protein